MLKMIPIIIAALCLNNVILSYMNISSDIPSGLGGISLLVWIYLYISSWVNGFCIYHRMFLYYIAIEETLAWYDYKIGIPISNKGMILLNLIFFGLTLIIVVYLKFKVCKKQ